MAAASISAMRPCRMFAAIALRALLSSISSRRHHLARAVLLEIASSQSRNWREVIAFNSTRRLAPNEELDFLFGGAVFFQLLGARAFVLGRLVLKLHLLDVREPQADIDHLRLVLEHVPPTVIRDGMGDGQTGAIEVMGDQDYGTVAAQTVEQVAAGNDATCPSCSAPRSRTVP